MRNPFLVIGQVWSQVRALLRFVSAGAGKNWGIGPIQRFKVGVRMFITYVRAYHDSATSYAEQIILLNALLATDRNAPGAVAEFGCYRGISTAALSIGCKLTGRSLLVFDSFEGLPDINEEIHNLATGAKLDYRKGAYNGPLDLVRDNVKRFGEIEVVEFIKGYFDSTLSQRPPHEQYCLIFEDADLPSSVKTVLLGAWHRLAKGSFFYCHESRDAEVVRIFFDREFWENEIGTPAPGLVGAGTGLPLNYGTGDKNTQHALGYDVGSCLAYTVKR